MTAAPVPARLSTPHAQLCPRPAPVSCPRDETGCDASRVPLEGVGTAPFAASIIQTRAVRVEALRGVGGDRLGRGEAAVEVPWIVGRILGADDVFFGGCTRGRQRLQAPQCQHELQRLAEAHLDLLQMSGERVSRWLISAGVFQSL